MRRICSEDKRGSCSCTNWKNQSAATAPMLMFIFAYNATNQRDLGSERLGNAWIFEQFVYKLLILEQNVVPNYSHNGCINKHSHEAYYMADGIQFLKGCRLRELLYVQILGGCVVILGSVYTWRCVEYCA